MPAPDTGGTETPPGARAIVEALGLDAGALADGDLSALTYQHSNDQFNPSEFEALAHFPPELDCLNSTVEVESSLGDALDSGGEVLSVEETVESVEIVTSVHPNDVPHSPESILPDIVEEGSNDDMDINDMGISDSPETDALQLSSSSHHLASYGNSLAFTSSPMTAKTPQAGSSIVVIQSPVASSTCLTPTSFSQTHVTVSGGQIVGKISGLSGNVPIGSMPQFQPITQTLVTAKSSDGNIVQLRPTNVNRQATLTTSSNFTSSALQGIKPLQATVKRPAAATSGQIRNVFAKVIITGNQQNQQGQPVMLTTSQAEGLTAGQPLKIVTSTGQSTSTLLASPTKAITLAQAQQMGLIQPTRIHSVTPSSPSKNIVVNKFVTSPVKMPAKLVMPASTVVKIPTKILPAPTSMQQSLGGVATVSGATSGVSTVNTTVKPLSPQKVIIRQGSLKPGTVLTSTTGTGQVISIPATQNVMGPAVSIGQVQMQGTRQLQYVRLVSTASGTTSTVASTARASIDGGVPATAVSATARPLAMSTVRSQPQAVKMVPIAPAAPSVRTVVPKPATGQPAQRILIPAATPVTQLRGAQNVATLQASTVTGAAILPSGGNSYVMLPAHYVEQVKNLQAQQQLNQQKQQEQQLQQEEQQQEQKHGQSLQQAQQQQRQHQQSQLQSQKEKAQAQQQDSSSANSLSSAGSHTQTSGSMNTDNPAPSSRSGASSRATLEPNGIRPRKPCNCTKSQCLKLYCDCFANGEFCHMCNCNNCYNNLDHEEDRQRAIKSCLERNPNAFRPKIGKGMVGDERRHNKGCNCKRSGCLKNYCECYEAKIPCSNNCRCIGCRNVEESCEKKSLRDLADAAEVRVQQQTAIKNKLSAHIQDIARPQATTQSGSRHAFNFMTQDVIHATCQCMLAQAEDSERSNNTETQAERLILEEFGRCLVQIIDCASKTEASAVQM